ncbi:MAG: hypothetical protein AAF558_04085 [Verrucomicrobiota bacterium]
MKKRVLGCLIASGFLALLGIVLFSITTEQQSSVPNNLDSISAELEKQGCDCPNERVIQELATISRDQELVMLQIALSGTGDFESRSAKVRQALTRLNAKQFEPVANVFRDFGETSSGLLLVLNVWSEEFPAQSLEYAQRSLQGEQLETGIVMVFRNYLNQDFVGAIETFQELPRGSLVWYYLLKPVLEAKTEREKPTIGKLIEEFADDRRAEVIAAEVIAEYFGSNDPLYAESWVASLDGAEFFSAQSAFVRAWEQNNVPSATTWMVENLQPSKAKQDLLTKMICSWMDQDAPKAIRFVQNLEFNQRSDQLLYELSCHLAPEDPEKAMVLAQIISDKEVSKHAITEVLQVWKSVFPEAAEKWATENSLNS